MKADRIYIELTPFQAKALLRESHPWALPGANDILRAALASQGERCGGTGTLGENCNDGYCSQEPECGCTEPCPGCPDCESGEGEGWPEVWIRKDTMASDESGWILVAPGHEAYPGGRTTEPHHRVRRYVPAPEGSD